MGYLYQKQNDVVSYFQLRSVNDSLLKENKRLLNELTDYKFIDTLQDIQRKIPIIAYDTTSMVKDSAGNKVPTTNSQYSAPMGQPRVVKYADYHYQEARVINNSVANDRNNYLTINIGSKQGVKKDMAVVSSEGVVGRVAHVSKYYATVITLLSSRTVSTQIKNNVGVINWTTGLPEYVTMSQIELHARIKKGDTVVTTGYSIFPENVMVGTVSKVDTYKVTNTLNLKVRLSTNFRNLKYVYVVMDDMQAERAQLEAETQAADKAELEKK